jgi:thiol:disulfide interchange protein DsbC
MRLAALLLTTGVAACAHVGGAARAIPATDAAVAPAADDAVERLRTTLQVRFPEIRVASIVPAPVSGWYEVVSASAEIAYVDASGEYLLVGALLATRGRENLTQKRMLALQAVDFDSLPFDSAVKVVKGAGARRVAVFADPLCPFCRKLEQTLQSVDDVTVYTFVMPLEDLHPGASATATHIWCAEDPAAAWLAWMLDKRAPPAKSCDGDPGRSVKELGDRLRVVGTPTMFFPDGSRLFGAPDAAAFEEELQRRQRPADPASPVSRVPIAMVRVPTERAAALGESH